MTTLENIHEILENKISLIDQCFRLFKNLTDTYNSYIPDCEYRYNNECGNECNNKCKNELYVYRKNIDLVFSNLKSSKEHSEEYSIQSAYFLFQYNKAVIMDEVSESNMQSVAGNEYKQKYNRYPEILELINIYNNNTYNYKSYKTAGNNLNTKLNDRNKTRLKNIYDDYKTFICKCNIVDKLDNCMKYLFNFFRLYYEDNQEFMNLYKSYNNLYLSLYKDSDKDVVYDVCECGNKMNIQTNTSELLCVRCGYTVYLIGSVTEENQLFAQEGNRVSHGSYDPARHCKFWIERIQAKESTVIPQEYIDKIKKSIKKDRIENMKSISVKQFRAYLKQNNLSKLNDHIPLIKKTITGYIPPQLTYREQQLLFIYFDKATKSYDKIKPPNKKNSLYYPFLIYKILDLIILDENKKQKLLSCIHLQSYETLIDNDKIWQSICKQNDCFTYRATNKSD